MLCLFSCLLGWKNLPFLKEISVQSPIHWTHRVLVFHTAQSTAQLLSQQRYHCAMKGSQGQISLSPKWRQQREANSSWASQRAAHWEWCSQSWEISGTREEGWEEGQGDLGRGLEVLKVRRELRLQRGGCLATEPGKTRGWRERGRLVWFDCCGPCLLFLHCSGHVSSGQGMEDTWHSGSQQLFLCPVSVAFLFLDILGHHSPRALLRCESRSRWPLLPVISVSTLPSWWLAADTQVLWRCQEIGFFLCWLFYLLLQRAFHALLSCLCSFSVAHNLQTLKKLWKRMSLIQF